MSGHERGGARPEAGSGPPSGHARPGDPRTLPGACAPGPSGRCSVCGDEGRIGVVEALVCDGAAARVRMEDTGALEEVALDLVDPVAPPDRLVIHMGFALATVRQEGA